MVVDIDTIAGCRTRVSNELHIVVNCFQSFLFSMSGRRGVFVLLYLIGEINGVFMV